MKLKKIKIVLSMILIQRKAQSKKLSRYVTIFDYIDKILVILSATTGGISIASFTAAIGAPVNTVFILIFSLTTGIVKKLLNMTINKKKKHEQ